MLLGEDLRGRHERGLPAVLGSADGGKGGNYRLARSDVSLQQSQHGNVAGEILQHLAKHSALGAGQLKSQLRQQHPSQLLGSG